MVLAPVVFYGYSRPIQMPRSIFYTKLNLPMSHPVKSWFFCHSRISSIVLISKLVLTYVLKFYHYEDMAIQVSISDSNFGEILFYGRAGSSNRKKHGTRIEI